MSQTSKEIDGALWRARASWLISLVLTAGAVGTSLVAAWPVAPGEGEWTAGHFVFDVLAFIVPTVGAYWAHWRFFRRHWSRGRVSPRGYIRAEVSLHVGLCLSAVLLGVDSVIRRSSMPEFPLMLVPTVLLLLAWPSGWAMTRSGAADAQDEDEALNFPPDRP